MAGLQETADLIVEYYNLFSKISTAPRSIFRFPPHDSDTPKFNTDLCAELGMTESAIEFINKIAWINDYDTEILFKSRAINYSDDYDLRMSRDPQLLFAIEPEPANTLDGWMVPLTGPNHATLGTVILVDTKNNLIYDWDTSGNSPIRPENWLRPDDDGHYLNWIPQSPRVVLGKMIEEIKTLTLIPGEEGEMICESSDPEMYPRYREILVDSGWFGSFDKEKYLNGLKHIKPRFADDEEMEDAEETENEGETENKEGVVENENADVSVVKSIGEITLTNSTTKQ